MAVVLTIAFTGACAAGRPSAVPAEREPPARVTAAAIWPSSTPKPSYAPGPDSTGGIVLSGDGRRLSLQTVEHGTIEVDLRSVREVWKETEVAASALEAGDDVALNGRWSAGDFVAAYVWANIGRLDGVIRAVDGDVLTVDATVRTGAGFGTATRQVELSPYVTFVAPLTRADLVPGRAIGAVLYAPKSGLPRLTRVW